MAKTRTLKVAGREVHVPHTLLDRAIERIAPTWGMERLKARTVTAMNGGYSGASVSRGSLQSWTPHGYDADAVSADLPMLRARSSDLVRNSAVAGGALTTAELNVIGTGLAMNPRIDFEALGISEEDATRWQHSTAREFEVWAESIDFSANRRGNFYSGQTVAFLSAMEKGDVLITTPMRPSPRQPYKLCIQLTEAERVSNPHNKQDTDFMVGGVELNEWGEQIAYHVSNRHPGSLRARLSTMEWKRIGAWGMGGTRRNAWLLLDARRVGQTRGIPWLASVIEPLKQLERYTDAELNAAVISAMFTVFIESEFDGGTMDILADASGSGQTDEWDGRLRNGAAVALNPGDKISTANPGRPNAQFEPFVKAIFEQVGMRLQIPTEVLIKHYTSSYTAARAALQDAWRFFRNRRAWMVENFCQPIYELWLMEAVSTGRVSAPGFFTDPVRRRAWCAAEWVGDGPNILDPMKEIGAAEKRVDLGISTLAAESLLHDGVDWETKHRQRVREVRSRERDGLVPEPTASPAHATPSPDTTARNDVTVFAEHAADDEEN